MQCPNCNGSDIDLSFVPPRCRFCDPVDETRTDRIIQRWLLEDSMRGLEIRKRATGILRVQATQAGRPIVAQEEGRSLLTLLDRIADTLSPAKETLTCEGCGRPTGVKWSGLCGACVRKK